jgi:two-component system sensor histidine kinase KdpD
VPKGLPLIKADPVLLAQLIENLLDNALKYTAQPIDLTVSAQGSELLVLVKDRGPGIPMEKLSTILEPYSRSDQSGQHGSGLGLALCRAVAQAHGGNLSFRPRGGGGSCFSVTLPIEAQQPGGVPA